MRSSSASPADLSGVIAVVLAGGFGTRIKHLLGEIPKPMAPAAGKPFLEWVVRYLAKQGIREVILSTGHLSEVVETHFQTQPVPEIHVRCVPETTPLGTAGGFLHAVQVSGAIPQAWLLLNGDTLIFANMARASRLLSEPGVSGVIVGRQVPDASRYGTLVVGPNGKLLRFEEKKPGRGIISTGIYLFQHSLLKKFSTQLPSSLEKDVFPALLQQEVGLKVEITEAPFLDIGTPESLPEAGTFIKQNSREFIQ